jgi:YggT family protein
LVIGNVDTGRTASAAVEEELIMSLIGALVGYALSAFILLLLARMVLDWSGVLASGPQPQWVSRARQLTHAWTEPVIAPVRRVLRPVRAGGLSIDLAFTAVVIAVLILRSIAFSL